MSIATLSLVPIVAVSGAALFGWSAEPPALGTVTSASVRTAASVLPRAESACVVSVRREARYRGLGYDHIVHLDSACSFALSCTVTTSANPKTLRVHVNAGRQVELLTYRGSPSRTFNVSVSCERAE